MVGGHILYFGKRWLLGPIVLILLFSFSAGVVLAVPPSNDNIANATFISSLPYSTSITNQDEATMEGADPNPSCEFANAGVSNTVWYRFIVATAGTVTLDTGGSNPDGGGGSPADTVLAVYTGSPGSLTEVGCNDDAAGLASPFNSRISNLPVTAGTTYYVMMANFNSTSLSTTGTLFLNVSGTATLAVPPANDNIANATQITTFPFSASQNNQFLATMEGADPNPSCEFANAGVSNTVWYRFTIVNAGTVTLDTGGSNPFGGAGSPADTVLAVYAGSPHSTTEVACNDDYSSTPPLPHVFNSRISNLAVTAGTTYYVMVANLNTDPVAPGTIFLNISSTAMLSTPPTVTINQAAGQADLTNTSPISFDVVFSTSVTGFDGSDISFTGSTVGGTLLATVSGSGANYTVSVSGMTGTGTVVASIPSGRAVDSAGTGNAASTSTDNIVTFDTTAPDTTITPVPPNPSNSSSVNFSFSGIDSSGVAGYECQLDGGGFSACTSPQSYTGLSDGSNTFQVRAVDNVGNVDLTPASYTWVIDTTAPDTTITAVPPNPTNSSSVDFSFSGIDSSGVAGYECQLDGGGFSACTSPQSYTGLSDGSHTFQVRAVDNAGNVDLSPATFTWVIDPTAPPAPVITAPVDGSQTNDNTPTVTGTAEADSTVTVFIDGTPVGTTSADGAGTFSFTLSVPLSDGSHTVMARATDAVGNTSADSNTNTFMVDTTALIVTINQGASQSDPTGSSPITFDVSFSEPVIGFASSGISFAGSTVGGTLNASVSGSGATYTITVSGMSSDGIVIVSINPSAAQDAAGNTNAASTSTDNSVTYYVPGIVVSPTSGLVTTEGGGTAAFDVVLNSQPTADVTINLVSSDTSEGTVAPGALTFTAADWNVAQTVTVTGPDDAVADGDIAYTILTSVTSADPDYAAIDPYDVSVINTDDDTAGITVAPTTLIGTEGDTLNYQIQFVTPPTGAVTVQIAFDPAQVNVNGSSISPVTLTIAGSAPQTVMVLVVQNPNEDRDRSTVISHAITASGAAEYPVGLPLPDVTVNIEDVTPPPSTPVCEDHNFAEGGVVRASTRDGLDYAINCRVLYQNGSPTQWLGGDLYNSGSIGIQGVLDLGVQQAVDIFSPVGRTYFEGGAVFCLRGSGTLIWMAASQTPRHAEIIGSYTVEDFFGFTCATLFEPGTLVLVSRNPVQ